MQKYTHYNTGETSSEDLLDSGVLADDDSFSQGGHIAINYNPIPLNPTVLTRFRTEKFFSPMNTNHLRKQLQQVSPLNQQLQLQQIENKTSSSTYNNNININDNNNNFDLSISESEDDINCDNSSSELQKHIEELSQLKKSIEVLGYGIKHYKEETLKQQIFITPLKHPSMLNPKTPVLDISTSTTSPELSPDIEFLSSNNYNNRIKYQTHHNQNIELSPEIGVVKNVTSSASVAAGTNNVQNQQKQQHHQRKRVRIQIPSEESETSSSSSLTIKQLQQNIKSLREEKQSLNNNINLLQERESNLRSTLKVTTENNKTLFQTNIQYKDLFEEQRISIKNLTNNLKRETDKCIHLQIKIDTLNEEKLQMGHLIDEKNTNISSQQRQRKRVSNSNIEEEEEERGKIIREENEALEENNQILNENNAVLKEDNQVLRAEIFEKEQKIESLSTQLSHNSIQDTQLKKQILDLNSSYKELHIKYKEIKKINKRIRKERDELKEQNSSLLSSTGNSNNIKDLPSDLEQMEISAIVKENRMLSNLNHSLQLKVQKLESVESYNSNNNHNNNISNSSHHVIEELKRQIKKMKKFIIEKDKEIEEIIKDYNECQNMLKISNERIEDIKKQFETSGIFTDSVEEIQKKYNRFLGKYDHFLKMHQTCKKNNRRLSSQVKFLKDKAHQLKKERRKLQILLERNYTKKKKRHHSD